MKLSWLAVAAAPVVAAVNMTITQKNATIAPSPLPPPGSSSQGEEIVRQFSKIDRTTKWKLVEEVPFEGDLFEPEGIVRMGDNRYFVSAGEYTVRTQKYNQTTNGTDRTTGEGFGHMIVFDGKGRRIADATISRPGSSEYHNGGIDYDGTYLWATLSQYRPNSTATLVRMDPATLEPEEVLRVHDHQGGAVHDWSSGVVLTLNWGSREASLWDLGARFPGPPAFAAAPRARVRNPSHYTDYQDCKYLGHSQRYGFRPVMLCGGITGIYDTTIGGLAVVDMLTMAPLMEVPLTLTSAQGNLVTKNPVDVAVVGGRLRFFFLPDEHNSALYVYEPVI
ncbi:uncharacterized protein E0L32_008677 [Thyridium curvatum]|uniref:Uncharacterized protein n=1 Tax=Thyridium curvatum TaxID=1093900 RepID=A0A507B0F3_9PEZI|nr:uncharacterized protein E0L32_008677 [Thyridium curvatum]TPX10458.1 hypothetical protein E0L32_008677 [Thyridium curvatum]